MGVKFNEGLAREAIVRRIESRDQRVRANVRFPEKEQHAFSVEATFEIGDQLYAMERTGIEPFEGHMKMEGEAERHFVPIVDALKGYLDTAALFELYMPVDAFRGRRKTKVRSIQRKLIDWVKATAPTVQKPTIAYRGNSTGLVNISGVPFAVSLSRFEPPLFPGKHFQIRPVVGGGEQARADRIKKAIEDKFPKLTGWKCDAGARTILVLQCNDIQLTNPANVTETFVPQANARKDRPDETYLVMSCMQPWLGYPILIDDKSFFDLAKQEREGTVY